jgi:hypothetical protein
MGLRKRGAMPQPTGSSVELRKEESCVCLCVERTALWHNDNCGEQPGASGGSHL